MRIDANTSIQTTGLNAHGIFGQSLGGNGGIAVATLCNDVDIGRRLQESLEPPPRQRFVVDNNAANVHASPDSGM